MLQQQGQAAVHVTSGRQVVAGFRHFGTYRSAGTGLYLPEMPPLQWAS